MNGPNRIPDITASHPIWQALQHYIIGPADAEFSFAERLARENGWTAAQAGRVLGEYRRFCFLAVTAGHEVTPSDAVDQAWHLHLTYSRDYWDRFCPEVLGCKLHHGPTTGGAAQRSHFFSTYAETLRSYEAAFGEPPPADLWPNAHQRLVIDPQARRVHLKGRVIVSRRTACFVLFVLTGAVLIALWQLFGSHPS